jgi:prevent-host-death family protein
MPQLISLKEAQTRLPDLVEAVKHGETIFIAENDRPVARLVPVVPVARQPRFGSARGLLEIADDFDAPLLDFSDYEK